MSADGERDDGAEDTGEGDVGGLGLTEEFARIESEIEREGGRREVRFDETDSTEFVAPLPPRPGRETDEWSVSEATGPEAPGEEGGEVDPAGGEADPPEEPVAPADPAPDPSDDDAAATPPPESDEAVHDGVPDAPAVPPAEAEAEPADESEPEEALLVAAEAPAAEHTIVQDRPLVRAPVSPGPPLRPAPVADEDIEDRTPALWWRFLAGSVMIVASIATAVVLSSLLVFGGIADAINNIDFAPGVLDTVQPGEPQTILLVGSDKRSNTPGDPGRSDTTMLLRLDPEKQLLSLMSLPRDLEVDIAGDNYGVGKLNEAFTVGGIQKTTKTVKDLTGLEINHVVNVDFQGFADAVDAIGCVYIDVDRDYFNDNSTALSAADEYATIDVNAGYQRLCGLNALDYVRYRHSDNDFVRSARQQDFLRNARAQVPIGELAPIIGGDTGSKLIDIFTKYTSSDVKTTGEILSVLKTLIGVRDVPVREIQFPATDKVENGVAYVVASPKAIDKAVAQFLGEDGGSGSAPPTPASKQPEKPKQPKSGSGGSSAGSGGGDGLGGANVVSAADAEAACGEGTDKVAAFGRTSARRLKFPVYVPGVLVPGSCYDEGSRQYDIKDTEDEKQPAYKMVVALNSDTAAGEYYGVEGTTWQDPPILDKPSETREIDGRAYDLYYDGDRLRLVAFHDERGNSYWVSNTLLQTLDEKQMLAIAASMKEVRG